jgi:hypothetical protein
MPRFLDAPQGSDAWFSYRAGHATASRFVDVIGSKQTREAYLWELVGERLMGGPRRDGGGRAKEWGHLSEPKSRLAYQIRSGNLVREVGFALHDRIKWLGCSSDGLIGEDGAIESKSPFNSAIHARTLAKGMPEEHRPQVMGNLLVLERKWIAFLSYDEHFPAPYDLYDQVIERDQKYIDYLEVEVKKFLAEVNIAVRDIKATHNK